MNLNVLEIVKYPLRTQGKISLYVKIKIVCL